MVTGALLEQMIKRKPDCVYLLTGHLPMPAYPDIYAR